MNFPAFFCTMTFGATATLSAYPGWFGNFKYVADETYVQISDYNDLANGPAVIPSEIDGKPVTEIGTLAFAGCSGLTSVTIPPSVTMIGNEVFLECTGLTSIAIPSSVTEINYRTFYGCTSLTSVAIPPSVSYIGDEAFSGCTGLTSVTIPNGVTTIEGFAFYDCRNLKNISLPSSINAIRKGAFLRCKSLAKLPLPENVKIIDRYVFSGCDSLSDINIPNGITIIQDEAFQFCSKLRNVTIPSGVTRIGHRAFDECPNLAKFTLLGDAPIFGPDSTSVDDPYWVFVGFPKHLQIWFDEAKAGFTDTNKWGGYDLFPLGPQIGVNLNGVSMVEEEKIRLIAFKGEKTRSQKFTVLNNGSQRLKSLHVRARGPDSRFFIITQPQRTFLNPGEKTSFKVTFSPGTKVKVIRKSTISIRSNDAGNNPFTFQIIGKSIGS